jgi:cytoskeletal protein CcmA (bactofilin family)
MNPAREDSDISVVGRGARIQGTLVSAGSVWVRGHLTGEISAKAEVLVSTDSVVEANITAGSISLAGRISGNLSSPGAVSLPSQSRVEGDVHARSVTVQGSVKGDLVAEDRVELGEGAWVDGNITCRILVVAEGAVFSGRSTMGKPPHEPGNQKNSE